MIGIMIHDDYGGQFKVLSWLIIPINDLIKG